MPQKKYEFRNKKRRTTILRMMILSQTQRPSRKKIDRCFKKWLSNFVLLSLYYYFNVKREWNGW